MIKKMIKIPAIGLILLAVNVEANTQVNCDDLTGCKKKICNLEKDIAIAKEMKNTARVNGLEISLEKVNTHCTDDKLIEAMENKIDDTKEDLEEHKKEYAEALEDNKPDKVKKYKTKMAEEEEEIIQLKEQVKELQ